MTSIKTELIADLNIKKSQSYLAAVMKCLLIGSSGRKAVLWFRLAKKLKGLGFHFTAKFIVRRLEVKYGLYIGLNTTIGKGLKLPHPVGVVIGDGVTIGDNCTIYQQVTIGGARLGDAKSRNYPVIENSVILFSGAKVLGSITIGNNTVVGANSVVTKNVPEGATVGGVPAKVIKLRQSSLPTP